MLSGKKIFLIIVIILLLLLLFFTKNKWLPFLRKAFAGNPSCHSNFLFIGDSLTAFNSSYADQLQSVCPDINYNKIAAIGKDTAWMLAQLKQELANGNKYDVITVWGGVNDIYGSDSIDAAKNNLREMVKTIKDSGASAVVLTVIPTATYTNSTARKVELTHELNTWIKSNLLADYIVDANRIMNDGSGGTKQVYLQPDTLHLTPVAHKEIMYAFKNIVIK